MCGRLAETRDHIPPQAIFSNPKPTNLITVPACKRCNHGSTLDDEYFRWFVTTSSSDMPKAQKLVLERILKRSKKRPALLQGFMKKTIKVDVFSQGGLFIKQVPALKYDRTRVKNIIEKTIRGLYWHKKKQAFDDKYTEIKFVLYLPPPNKQPPFPPEDCQKALLSSPLNIIGDGKTFAYHYYTDPENDRITIWLLLFFEITGILAMTFPKEQS